MIRRHPDSIHLLFKHWLFPVVVVLVLRTESVVGVLELLVVIEVVLKLGIVVAVVNTLRKFGV